MGPISNEQKAQEILDQLPKEVRDKYAIDNEGNTVLKNRAYRRRKLPSDPKYTKKTPKPRKKVPKKYGQSKHNR